MARTFKSEKEKFGFTVYNYIWGVKGNTYEVKDELKEIGFRFSRTFLWTLVAAEAPSDLPEGLTPFKIEWDKISYTSPTGEEKLINDRDIAAYLDTMRYDQDTTSEWVGAEGERLELAVKVVAVREINSAYGLSTMYEFESDGNTFIWFTSSVKTTFNLGEECVIRGTVKDHKTFRNKKQTVLSRVNRKK